MLKILIPVGDITLRQLEPICKDFNCGVKFQDRQKVYFEVNSDDPLNFFWLGMNLNNRLNGVSAIPSVLSR